MHQHTQTNSNTPAVLPHQPKHRACTLEVHLCHKDCGRQHQGCRSGQRDDGAASHECRRCACLWCIDSGGHRFPCSHARACQELHRYTTHLVQNLLDLQRTAQQSAAQHTTWPRYIQKLQSVSQRKYAQQLRRRSEAKVCAIALHIRSFPVPVSLSWAHAQYMST